MHTSPTPVLLLTGYLGSGKTTLVNHILTNERGIRFAVIVNDIGEVNIDAELIQKGGIVGQDDESLVALQNGCICCTLQTDLLKQIAELTESDRFDYIVIEASGICEPEPIARTLVLAERFGAQTGVDIHRPPRLDCICTVVDALRMRDEFANGENLEAENLDEEAIENLIIQQIEFCNIVLLNKISEVTDAEARTLRRVIRAIQPEARIIDCDYADVDLSLLLDTHLFDYSAVSGSATWVKELERPVDEIEAEEHHEHHHEHEHEHEHEHHHHHEHDDEHHHHHEHDHDHECGPDCHCHHHHHHHGEGEAEEYGITTFVYYRREPFDLTRFDRFVGQNWPKSIIRAKGICYFKENPDMSYMFETAGRQKKILEAGRWYATAPEEELKQIMAREPGLVRDWDDEYGDRMQKIVIIGRGLDKNAIIDDFDACLYHK